MLPRSPGCSSGEPGQPCAAPSGLRCAPADAKSPWHCPYSCTWIPCLPGLKPLMAAITLTLDPTCVNVTVPPIAGDDPLRIACAASVAAPPAAGAAGGPPGGAAAGPPGGAAPRLPGRGSAG